MEAVTPDITTSIEHGGRRVLLKWHKLCQRAEDTPFSMANLRAGLAAGASLEVDIQALADDAWVCLHGDALEEETTGHGPVKAAETATIRSLSMLGGDYSPPFLADMALGVAAAPTARGCLQLDLKESAAGLSPAAIKHFATMITPVASGCLLSGTDWEAVCVLAASVPALRLGFDPLELAERRTFDDPGEIAAFAEEVAAIAPAAAVFYLNYQFVLRALDLGVNPLEPLKRNGAMVDVWTLDPTTPEIGGVLTRVIDAGADQITTNDPIGMARLWSGISGDV